MEKFAETNLNRGEQMREELRIASTVVEHTQSKARNCLVRASMVYLLVCLLGCAYQTYVISEVYFNRDISSETSIELPTRINAPAITLCFDFFRIIDVDKFPGLDCWNSSAKKPVEQCLKVFRNKTVGQRMDATYGFEDLIDFVAVRDPVSAQFMNYSPANGSLYSNFTANYSTTFLKRRLKCFILNMSGNLQHTFYRMTDLKFDFKLPHVMVHMKLNNRTLSKATRVLVNLNSPESLPRGYKFNPVELEIVADKKMLWVVSYRRMETHLLPAPFATDCRDYSESGFFSQDHCLEECIGNSYLRKTGRYPSELFHDESHRDFKLGTIKDLAYRECNHDCQQVDCDSETFVPKLMYQRKRDGPQNMIYIVAPKVPDFVVKNSPRVSLAEYIIYVASMIGLWFGFSVFSTLSNTRNLPKVVNLSYLNFIQAAFQRPLKRPEESRRIDNAHQDDETQC